MPAVRRSARLAKQEGASSAAGKPKQPAPAAKKRRTAPGTASGGGASADSSNSSSASSSASSSGGGGSSASSSGGGGGTPPLPEGVTVLTRPFTVRGRIRWRISNGISRDRGLSWRMRSQTLGGSDQDAADRFPLLFVEDIMAEQMRPRGFMPPRMPGQKPTAAQAAQKRRRDEQTAEADALEPVYSKSSTGAWYQMEGRFASMEVTVQKYQSGVMRAAGTAEETECFFMPTARSLKACSPDEVGAAAAGSGSAERFYGYPYVEGEDDEEEDEEDEEDEDEDTEAPVKRLVAAINRTKGEVTLTEPTGEGEGGWDIWN